MTQTYSFTTMQCLNAIANWNHAPFTKKELTYLIKFFAGTQTDNHASYEYGQNDIESFILETLSEIDN